MCENIVYIYKDWEFITNKRINKQKKILSPFIFKMVLFLSSMNRNMPEAAVCPPSHAFSALSIWKLEYLFLLSSIFLLISLFHYLFQIQLHNYFLCSFVSSFWQLSSHLETAASAIFFMSFW